MPLALITCRTNQPDRECDDCGTKGISRIHSGSYVPPDSGKVALCTACWKLRVTANRHGGFVPQPVGYMKNEQ